MFLSPQSRLVVKTSLKLLIVFVEYSESNSPLLINAVNTVDGRRGKRTHRPLYRFKGQRYVRTNHLVSVCGFIR